MKEEIKLVDIMLSSIIMTIFFICLFLLWDQSKNIKRYEATTNNYSNSVDELLPVPSNEN